MNDGYIIGELVKTSYHIISFTKTKAMIKIINLIKILM